MKLRKMRWPALLLGLMLLPACAGTMIDVSRVGPLIDNVADRHDAMVNGTLDPATITPEDKATFLRSTELLRAVVNQARANAGPEKPGN